MKKRFDRVWHWSRAKTFRRPLKLKPSPSVSSLEGIGLSVSVHPLAWRKIARLGGMQLHELSRIDGSAGQFIVHDIKLEAAAMAWGVRYGWLTPSTQYRVPYYDTETEEEYVMTFDSRAQAEQEASDTDAEIVEEVGYRGTERMHARLLKSFPARAKASRVPPGESLARIEAGNMFVAVAYPDADGLWWEENLDPTVLSAPRGNILPHAIARWDTRPVGENAGPEETWMEE